MISDITSKGKKMFYRNFLLFVSFMMIMLGTALFAEAPLINDYQTLVTKVKNGDANVDFKALRIAYSQTPQYNPYSEDENMPLMLQALNDKAYPKALEYARKINEKNFTDLDAHFGARMACREMGDQACYDSHHTTLANLIDSIMNSGDGTTPESALQVITTREEYIILKVLNLQPKQQKLQQINEKAYDVFEVSDSRNNETFALFFDVTLPYNWLNESLKKK